MTDETPSPGDDASKAGSSEIVNPEDRKWAIMAVELNTPDGPIRGQVQVDTGPMKLSELVPTANELTGVLAMRANRKSEQEGRKVTCGPGCGACCRQMVPVSPPEAYFLMDLVDGLDPIRRAQVIGRFEDIEAQLNEKEMVEPMLDITVGADPHRNLNRKYFMMQLACPFLVDESCSIHHDRPVACRDFNVTSPASWCLDPFTTVVDKVPMPMPMSAPLSWLTAELTGKPPALIPLALIPRWVEQNPEFRTKKWPGLELFQHFMKVAGEPRGGDDDDSEESAGDDSGTPAKDEGLPDG